MSNENVAASAPVHQLVRQIRGLLDKATSSGKGWKAEYCGHDEWRIKAPHPIASACCPDLGCANNVHAIVAVFNALPALLAIAEAAADVIESRYHPQYDMTEKLNTLECATIDLRTALSLLPNAKAQPADQTAPPTTPCVAGSADATC